LVAAPVVIPVLLSVFHVMQLALVDLD
jgi:hypothetical protein